MKIKKTSRLAALAMALLTTVMAFLTAAMPALAADGCRITIHPNGQPLAPEDRFQAYQIFKGEVGTDPEQLDNLEWGEGVNHETLVNAMKESDLPLGDGGLFGPTFSLAYFAWSTAHGNETNEAEFVAQWLSRNIAGMPELADDFARLVAKHIATAHAESHTEGSDWVIDVQEPGYYIVIDTYRNGDNSPEPPNSSVSSYILEVLGTREVDLKATMPTVEKKVEGQDGYLAGTDEDVHFTIAGSIAENIGEYDTYFYEFTDTLSSGLSMEKEDIGSLQVKLFIAPAPGGKYNQSEGLPFEKWVDYQVELKENVLKVTFKDLKAAIEKHLVNGYLTDPAHLKDIASIRIVVFYTAHLNENAVTGKEGNANDVTLKYSNNPYSTGTGESVPDEVKTYTLALRIVKQDEKGGVLQGVRFRLKKKVSDEPDPDGTWQYATLTKLGDLSGYEITGWVDKAEQAGEFVTDALGVFNIHGLELGTYMLEETETKPNYELMEPVTFTIESADPDGVEENGDLHAQIQIDQETLSAGREDITWDQQYLSVSSAQVTLRNFPSPILPHTGGIGAAAVYAVSGIVILVGACVVLFTMRGKKKKAD